jgi:antibiotic biosynthesis monooxygenase (ABM) superfamily enzyme
VWVISLRSIPLSFKPCLIIDALIFKCFFLIIIKMLYTSVWNYNNDLCTPSFGIWDLDYRMLFYREFYCFTVLLFTWINIMLLSRRLGRYYAFP